MNTPYLPPLPVVDVPQEAAVPFTLIPVFDRWFGPDQLLTELIPWAIEHDWKHEWGKVNYSGFYMYRFGEDQIPGGFRNMGPGRRELSLRFDLIRQHDGWQVEQQLPHGMVAYINRHEAWVVASEAVSMSFPAPIGTISPPMLARYHAYLNDKRKRVWVKSREMGMRTPKSTGQVFHAPSSRLFLYKQLASAFAKAYLPSKPVDKVYDAEFTQTIHWTLLHVGMGYRFPAPVMDRLTADMVSTPEEQAIWTEVMGDPSKIRWDKTWAGAQPYIERLRKIFYHEFSSSTISSDLPWWAK